MTTSPKHCRSLRRNAVPRSVPGSPAGGPVRRRVHPVTWLPALVMAGSLAVSAPVLAATAPQSGAGGSGGSASGTSAANTSGSGHAASGGSGQSGSGTAGSGSAGKASGAGTANAAAGGGEKILQIAMPPCSTCHQVKPGVNQPGPSLAGVATRASQRIKAKDYKGKAKDARSYIRESIMDPNAYIVPGPAYATGGKSLMPTTYAQTLKPEQIDQIVSYLMTLK